MMGIDGGYDYDDDDTSVQKEEKDFTVMIIHIKTRRKCIHGTNHVHDHITGHLPRF